MTTILIIGSLISVPVLWLWMIQYASNKAIRESTKELEEAFKSKLIETYRRVSFTELRDSLGHRSYVYRIYNTGVELCSSSGVKTWHRLVKDGWEITVHNNPIEWRPK